MNTAHFNVHTAHCTLHTAHCQAAGGAEEEAEQLLEGPGTSPPYNRSCQVRSGPELAGKPILSYRDKQTCIRAIEDQERSVKDKQEFVKYVIEETGRLICEKTILKYVVLNVSIF